MKILVPTYAERTVKGGDHRFSVAPLFRSGVRPEADRRYDTALRKLRKRVLGRLRGLGKELRHDAVAAWGFNPEIKTRTLDFTVSLRRRSGRGRFLVAELEAGGARFAFFPRFKGPWFVLERGERLEERAQRSLGHFLKEWVREGRKDEGEVMAILEASRSTRAWISMMPLEFQTAQILFKPDPLLQQITGGERMDGATELEKIGICLDDLYPDDLDRALYRESEAQEVALALSDAARTAVAVLGKRGVGKTALVHECVFADMESRKGKHTAGRRFWLISPERLISGMSYVGQWERRFLAILRHAEQRDKVLYLDDLLGLYLAGWSTKSQFGALQALKPFIEERRVRVLAEMTPEVFRALREKDRGFADLLHVVRVREPAEAQTWRILGKLAAQQEDRFGTLFDPAAIPAVVDLQRRYCQDVAMPGAAAGRLKRLAAKSPGRAVGRKEVLEDFASSSGLQAGFMDERVKLAKADVVAALKSLVVGQDDAVTALADAVCVAKAGLNDPGRPLAAHLFLGPTGVGKTQCAKALAAYLFGDESRLLRFDMNACLDSGAVASLVGTLANPEGTLTSKVRQQPFCVLLFDEVEKAHPDALDLLLQVLGEGRLTDALGRTTDFTKAIVILTSNLGVRESGPRPGFTADEAAGRGGFLRAAEDFFRPEFFNRLDRILPFNPLDREDMKRIARLVIGDIFAREGLVRRNCVLQVEPGALDRVAEEGFDPQLGARALKRAMERLLTQPAAACLAALKPGSPALIRLFPAKGGMHVEVEALVEASAKGVAPAALDLGRSQPLCERTLKVLGDMKTDLDSLAPQGELGAEHYPFLAVREKLAGLKDAFLDLQDMLSRRKQVFAGSNAARHRSRVSRGSRDPEYPKKLLPVLDWKQLFAAEGHGPSQEWPAGAAVPGEGGVERRLRELLREVALVHLAVSRRSFHASERVLLCLKGIGEDAAAVVEGQLRNYEELFGGLMDLVVARPEAGPAGGTPEGMKESFLVVEGPSALEFARSEEGTHLFTGVIGHITALCVQVVPLSQGEDSGPAIRARRDQRAAWLERLAREGPGEPDPQPVGPVVRVSQAPGMTLDLRSGLMARGRAGAAELRVFLLENLPLPQGLEAARDG